MVLLKSVLIGLASAGLALFAMGLYVQGVSYRDAMSVPTVPGDSVDVRIHWHVPVAAGICTVAFAAGFWSQYRKTGR